MHLESRGRLVVIVDLSEVDFSFADDCRVDLARDTAAVDVYHLAIMEILDDRLDVGLGAVVGRAAKGRVHSI